MEVILFIIRRRSYDVYLKKDSPADVVVIAPETDFLFVFHVYKFENRLLGNHATQYNESWHNCLLGCSAQTDCLKFFIGRKTWPPLLKVEHMDQNDFFLLFFSSLIEE